eukprot:SAG31_NODE_4874_length_2892_cov_3.716076_3_plen_57_part_00
MQARAATQAPSVVFHAAEFLIAAGNYTYLGTSHGCLHALHSILHWLCNFVFTAVGC